MAKQSAGWRGVAVAAALLTLLLVAGVGQAINGAADTPTPTSSSAPVERTPAIPAELETGGDPATPPATSPTPAPVTPDAPGTQGAPPQQGPLSARLATEVLAELPVKGRSPKTGYDREGQFGTPWIDVDRNGCDTRNDVLRRDLTDAVLAGPCKVMSGTLVDPYTAQTIGFVRGNTTSTLVQIDHVVSLSDAWQKGAQALSPAQRVTFANDPLNLLAVDGQANQRKGDSDAATWLPQNRAFRCEYVARQISVKATYALWVTAAERDAMGRVLEACPGQRAADSPISPILTPGGVGEPVQSTPADAAAADVYYPNCAAAREAGAAPVRVGEPGYGRHLDRDGDGVGCE